MPGSDRVGNKAAHNLRQAVTGDDQGKKAHGDQKEFGHQLGDGVHAAGVQVERIVDYDDQADCAYGDEDHPSQKRGESLDKGKGINVPPETAEEQPLSLPKAADWLRLGALRQGSGLRGRGGVRFARRFWSGPSGWWLGRVAGVSGGNHNAY